VKLMVNALVAHDGLWMSIHGLRLIPINDVLWMFFGHPIYTFIPSRKFLVYRTSFGHPMDLS
jgi:hypothetical protein